jgi:hypothetical protein
MEVQAAILPVRIRRRAVSNVVWIDVHASLPTKARVRLHCPAFLDLQSSQMNLRSRSFEDSTPPIKIIHVEIYCEGRGRLEPVNTWKTGHRYSQPGSFPVANPPALVAVPPSAHRHSARPIDMHLHPNRSFQSPIAFYEPYASHSTNIRLRRFDTSRSPPQSRPGYAGAGEPVSRSVSLV